MPEALELLLITYNRAPALQGTLEALARSPFARLRLTVLDNASTDATPEVCAAFADRFADLRVVRHPRNLGGVANFLRAVELARAPYAWILADDDELHLDDAQDVLDAVQDGRADLISVGAPGREGWPAGRHTTARALVAAGLPFFHVFTFIPNTIFRTELFDGPALREGYLAGGDYYPHFPFLRRQVEERDARVYVSRHELVVRRGLSRPASELDIFVRWVRNCATIRDPRIRARAVYGPTRRRSRWFAELGGKLALERLRQDGRTGRLAGELALTLPPEQRAMLVAAAPVALLPRPVLRGMLRLGARALGTDLEAVEERMRDD